jgi:hypothetical protein
MQYFCGLWSINELNYGAIWEERKIFEKKNEIAADDRISFMKACMKKEGITKRR